MQKTCFLFGHADTPQSILPALEQAVEQEVSVGTTMFYVGYHGNFDHLAATALRAVKHRHPEIAVILVLAWHPGERKIELPFEFDGSFYPPLERVPRRYALVQANRYMVRTADSLICFVRYPGNSRNLLEYAQNTASKKNLTITNLAEQASPTYTPHGKTPPLSERRETVE